MTVNVGGADVLAWTDGHRKRGRGAIFNCVSRHCFVVYFWTTTSGEGFVVDKRYCPFPYIK
jgi:hypothetical protein